MGNNKIVIFFGGFVVAFVVTGILEPSSIEFSLHPSSTLDVANLSPPDSLHVKRELIEETKPSNINDFFKSDTALGLQLDSSLAISSFELLMSENLEDESTKNIVLQFLSLFLNNREMLYSLLDRLRTGNESAKTVLAAFVQSTIRKPGIGIYVLDYAPHILREMSRESLQFTTVDFLLSSGNEKARWEKLNQEDFRLRQQGASIGLLNTVNAVDSGKLASYVVNSYDANDPDAIIPALKIAALEGKNVDFMLDFITANSNSLPELEFEFAARNLMANKIGYEGEDAFTRWYNGLDVSSRKSWDSIINK